MARQPLRLGVVHDVRNPPHVHRDSDEVALVLAGEITFKIGDEVSVGGPGTCAFFPRNVPHAWKSTGSKTGRVLLRERYRWEVVGPNPL